MPSSDSIYAIEGINDPTPEEFKLSDQAGDEKGYFSINPNLINTHSGIYSITQEQKPQPQEVPQSTEQPDEEGLKDEFMSNLSEVDQFIAGWGYQNLFNSYQSCLAKLEYLPINEEEKRRRLEAINKIVFDGELLGRSVSPEERLGKWNYTDFLEDRQLYAELYADNPDLALSIFENGVFGAHGSTSASLQGVLDHGLRPQEFLRDKMPIASGEGVFGSANLNNKYISLAKLNDYKDAVGYAKRGDGGVSEESIRRDLREFTERAQKMGEENVFYESIQIKIRDLQDTLAFLQKPDKNDKEKEHEQLIRESFPVLYFVGADIQTGSDVSWRQQDKTTGEYSGITSEVIIPQSDYKSEICLKDGVPIEGIRIIFVPKDRIDEAKSMVASRGLNIEVSAIEDL